MVYFDVDTYRYFIGREDQSVNEKVMLSRIDQQLRITKEMIDARSIWMRSRIRSSSITSITIFR